MKSYLTHLECTYCGKTHSAEEIHTTCPACGKVLFARYDLNAARKNFSKDDLLRRAGNMWRWFEIMPVRDERNVVTLGEGYTPPANTASPVGVLEWDAASYFANLPSLTITLVNQGLDAQLSFLSQLGWDYRIETTTDLNAAWDNVVTLNGTGARLAYTQTNTSSARRFWRLEIKEGGFIP